MTKAKSRVYFTVAYSEKGSCLAWRYVRYLGTDAAWHPKIGDGHPVKEFKDLAAARKAAKTEGRNAVEKGWADYYGIARISETVREQGVAREITFINAIAP